MDSPTIASRRFSREGRYSREELPDEPAVHNYRQHTLRDFWTEYRRTATIVGDVVRL